MTRKLFIVFLAAVLCGCEVIREEDRLIPMAIVNGERVHVLVEYTGFRCVNCPEAAETAEALQALYGGQLVVVAMHPATNTFTQGAFDYTCPEADLCYRWMGGTATTPFPTGNIDMKETDGSFFLDRQQWASALLTAMEDDEAPYLHATATADSTGGITVTIQTQALQETEARMALWVTEDSVLGAQVMGDGTNNLSYYHRHVLRDALMDDPFGWEVTIGAEEQERTYRYTLPDGCNAAQCRFIALILDKNDKHILQAYETKLDDSSLAAGDNRR